MADYVSYVRQTVTIGAAAVVMVTGTLYLVGAAAGAMAVSTPQGASLTHDVRGGRKRQGTVGAPAPAASSAPKSTTSTGVGAPGSGAAVYETSKAVDEYLLFHYAPADVLMPYDFGPRQGADFPARLAELAAKHAPVADGGRVTRALDVGCAVGGATFALARHFSAAHGIDYSAAFVAAAKRLQAGERIPSTVVDEGTLTSWFVASAPSDVDVKRVTFSEGDACALTPIGAPFDAILAANLLCRLPDPSLFLDALPGLLTPDGIVALVSPYSWLEEWTPRDKWLGGVVRGGDAVYSGAELTQKMQALGFELVEQSDMPFVIREHARKFQWGCSHATVWRLKGAAAAEE